MTERDTERDETTPATPADPARAPDAAAPTRAGRDGAGHEGAARDEANGDGASDADRPREIGGQQGPEPTRYGDWEGKGRCTDF